MINEAFKTLHSPINRGEYILKLHGVTIPEGNSEMNQSFLLEMMKRNEEVLGKPKNILRMVLRPHICFWLQVDDAEEAKELGELLVKVRRDMEECASQLGKSLDASDFENAKSNLITFRYYVSLENSIKEKGRRLGIYH